MRKIGRVARRLAFVGVLMQSFGALAQQDNPYHINGDAFQENCNCYTLTPDNLSQSGSVWNVNKISLEEPFDFNFSVYLGCRDAQGADGIAFVLQPVSTSIGAEGGGMGYYGIKPSIGVLIDTWQNFDLNDPPADHISIHKDGFIDHSVMTDVTSPVPVLANGGNIEDCQWHSFRISWEPTTKLFAAYIDGSLRTSVTLDLVESIFEGDPEVYWGFTAATGGGSNHQRFCTSLQPAFVLPEGQTTCFPEIVHFIDSSTSFGTIVKWSWDFGDGTSSQSPQPPPHQYAQPGIYEVKLSIVGNNGCESEPFTKTITMGTTPYAAFTYLPFPVCEGLPVTFTDASQVEFGTVDRWKWIIGNDEYITRDPPPVLLSGTTNVKLSVGTVEGCLSGDNAASITSLPSPTVDFNASNVCLNEPLTLTGSSNNSTVPVAQWRWNFGDGSVRTSSEQHIDYQYRKGGDYGISLAGYASNGCPSPEVIRTITVFETHAFAGNDTIVAENQPFSLHGSGGEFYRWTPSAGLSADNIAEPVAILSRSTSLVLTVSSSAGCQTTDTVNIKVFKGPALYVPTAFSPDNNGLNDTFKFIAVGMASIDVFRVYNRYGQVVYSSPDLNRGWDGTVHGIAQPAGTYVWTIRGLDIFGAVHVKKGTVTLIR